MYKIELAELVRNGENASVEFKRDDIHPESLAAEMAALLNREGGYILLGVEDNGSVTGLAREVRKAEEWVMHVARDRIQPAVIPFWATVEWEPGTVVGIIHLPAHAPDKPYKAKRGGSWTSRIRAGTTARDATREEEERLYQQSGRLRYGLKPVLGTSLAALDRQRLRDYFERILTSEVPPDRDGGQWQHRLCNLALATMAAGHVWATVDGMLLFGKNPKRFLPQSGIRAICYPGTEPGYATRADEDLKGPLVSLGARDGSLIEPGIVDRAWDFVRRNTMPAAHLEGPRRRDRWEYPEEVVREAVVNALVHRDYSIVGTDILLTLFANRLEIASPGRLPNTMTPEGMRAGIRYARNQTLVNVMRDYGYVDARGMGVRNLIIPGMRAHNGTAPDLIEEEQRFMVRLWKAPWP